jgi:hypothetical protein
MDRDPFDDDEAEELPEGWSSARPRPEDGTDGHEVREQQELEEVADLQELNDWANAVEADMLSQKQAEEHEEELAREEARRRSQ